MRIGCSAVGAAGQGRHAHSQWASRLCRWRFSVACGRSVSPQASDGCLAARLLVVAWYGAAVKLPGCWWWPCLMQRDVRSPSPHKPADTSVVMRGAHKCSEDLQPADGGAVQLRRLRWRARTQGACRLLMVMRFQAQVAGSSRSSQVGLQQKRQWATGDLMACDGAARSPGRRPRSSHVWACNKRSSEQQAANGQGDDWKGRWLECMCKRACRRREVNEPAVR